MLSINTNLSSLIAQNSLKNSTNILNQAVERMTTGYKINHAKDNAANYSIATNMTTQLNSYEIAADNVANGMDLVTTAMDTISMMQDKAARLNALSTQARNGTYGAQSLSAINAEANAIMTEIIRTYNTSQYNGVDLFNRTAYTIASHLPQPSGVNDGARAAATPMPVAKEEYNGFIEDPETYTDAEVAAMTRVADVTTFTAGEKYSISSLEELQKLADYVNSGKDTTSVEFVLGADIDLSSISNWTPIGDYSTNTSYRFKGTFDGNGHVIKNLTIENETKNYQGLFGRVESGEIKNVALENVNVAGQDNVGGLVGRAYSTITNSYATGSVSGQGVVGGLVGYANTNSSITNSYATGFVTGQGNSVGGLVGRTHSTITNSYATGSVSGQGVVGGLVGGGYSTITNSYATGAVTGQSYVGGLVGQSDAILNSYATGDVSGQGNSVGGLVGQANNSITNCYATGTVTGQTMVGGLVGQAARRFSLQNDYATGDVTGQSHVGGLAGAVYADSDTRSISDSVSYSKVTGADSASTGSLIGGALMTYNGTSFGTLDISNCQALSIDGMNTIGGAFSSQTYPPTAITYNLSSVLAGISDVMLQKTSTTLQVGINSDSSCQLDFDTNFKFDISALSSGIETEEAFNAIVEFEKLLSDKATMLGAVQNRLESALESIEVNINNLASSRSTIHDADIAKESSRYIQQQILQQASSTLLATANQSPSIALQLI